MRIAETVTFGGSALDRAAHLRGNPDEVTLLWGDPRTRVLPLWRGKPLASADPHMPVWLPTGHPVLEHGAVPAAFLGLDDAGPRFAQDISAWAPDGLDPGALSDFLDASEQHHPLLDDGQSFVELRRIMADLSPRDAELVASAKALFGWHATHRFCSRCGAPTEMSMAGWQRGCPACGAQHFPRTDPVVIMLITRGNSVLVGRSPGWPDGMYSLLAGFVEPGETLEAAVRREVFEEAAIEVGAVSYLASQPWPYPSSLMVGCRGEALSEEITIDPKEIEDAIWVSREQMLDVFAGNHPQILPARKGAIAHFLLLHWLADRLD